MNQPNALDPLLSKLSKSENRMYDLLVRNGPTQTYVIWSQCSIGNPAAIKMTFNRKAEALGDPRRIKCIRVQTENQSGDPIEIGMWEIEIINLQNQNNASVQGGVLGAGQGSADTGESVE